MDSAQSQQHVWIDDLHFVNKLVLVLLVVMFDYEYRKKVQYIS